MTTFFFFKKNGAIRHNPVHSRAHLSLHYFAVFEVIFFKCCLCKFTKTQYVAPIEYFRMKAKKLMVSYTFTDQFYWGYKNLISHRTFGISLQVISDVSKQ